MNGLCACGCGQQTKVSAYSLASRGWVKGQPRKYVKGHNGRVPLAEQFWSQVKETDSCWLWTGTVAAYGYGQMRHHGRLYLAHRLAYELLVAPISDGLHIDHLCRVRACVRPDHLEPVTQAENNRRAAAVRTHCRHGHELDGLRHQHGRPVRYCKTCKQISNARRTSRRAA